MKKIYMNENFKHFLHGGAAVQRQLNEFFVKHKILCLLAKKRPTTEHQTLIKALNQFLSAAKKA